MAASCGLVFIFPLPTVSWGRCPARIQRLRFRGIHDQLTFFQHHHAFDQFQNRYAMGGDNQCAVTQPLVEALNKLPLGMFIQRGAGFVEQHDIGRSQQHSCQQDRLSLSTGQTVAAFHNGMRQPFGELFNESC